MHSLAIHKGKIALLSTDGEVFALQPNATLPAGFDQTQPILCVHAPYTATKLDLPSMPQLDLLELFAFVKPGQFCVPTIAGLCEALTLPPPENAENACISMHDCAQELLHLTTTLPQADQQHLVALTQLMQTGWAWAGDLLSALSAENIATPVPPIDLAQSRRIMMQCVKALPEWSENPPAPPADHHGISTEEVLETLSNALLRRGNAEIRPQQKTYASRITGAFKVPDPDMPPHIILAQAGTGTGKTLGYLAPAMTWAEKNESPVWLSTYTKNLQRQLEQETEVIYPNPSERHRKVATRKGRDNYICIQKYEELTASAHIQKTPRPLIAAGILSRWIDAAGSSGPGNTSAAHDGDFTGARYPGWLTGILGFANSLALADRNRECTYSACDHYKKCFVEASRRRAGHARLVIANHALVMGQAATAMDSSQLPNRVIFDEGHHLFDAADSAFAAHLSASEGVELRRWLLGNPSRTGKSHGRGIAKRFEGLITESDEKAQKALDDLLLNAKILPEYGALKRIEETKPKGVLEDLLLTAMQQIKARENADAINHFGAQTPLHPLDEAFTTTIPKAITALSALRRPMMALVQFLKDKADHDATEEFDPASHRRMEALAHGLQRRAENTIGAWISLLEDAADQTDLHNQGMVDWLEYSHGNANSGGDIGIYRHMVDPMRAFAQAMQPHTHGMVVTSATLTDKANDAGEDNWHRAEQRSGAPHFGMVASDRLSLPSPFDYAAQAKVILVTDIHKANAQDTALAMRDLFIASRGGAIGLFTAIHRLRQAANTITPALAQYGIDVLAQHLDNMDTGTLIDIFRSDMDSCLLGTDAVRDGVDVPGQALRLIAFDRVPWSRPTILHKRRRQAFGKRDYDDALTRMRLKQAFGRLIRTKSDKGVFVMLDSSFPSRLHDAFPETVTVEKLALRDAIEQVNLFLNASTTTPSMRTHTP